MFLFPPALPVGRNVALWQLHVPGVRAGRDFGWKRSNGPILVLWYSVPTGVAAGAHGSTCGRKSGPGYVNGVGGPLCSRR